MSICRDIDDWGNMKTCEACGDSDSHSFNSEEPTCYYDSETSQNIFVTLCDNCAEEG